MSNLRKLQNWLIDNKIDLMVINRSDEFLSEYIAPYAERLKWISNFSGSAGKALVMHKKAVSFVDGRYTIQVKDEVNKTEFDIDNISNFYNAIKKNLKKNFVLGLDPNLHSIKDFKLIKKTFLRKKINIELFKKNPIDILWKNQPFKPNTYAFLHSVKFSGKTAYKKISDIQSQLKFSDCDYYILTSLESIAWLLNLRGDDIIHTPLNLAYMIITRNKKVDLFIDKKKIKKIKNNLLKISNCYSLESIFDYIKKLPKKNIVGFDQSKTPLIFDRILKDNGNTIKYINDPCLNAKARKNSTEIKGARKANIRDGLSLTKFLYWLKNKMIINKTNEISACNKLLGYRKKNKLFYSLSFESISAIGKNAAIPHYRVSTKTNLPFKRNEIYLIDSGAQYLDGTTDITRTVILGQATTKQKDRFTRVLIGHIAIATKIFREGTRGSDLDILARESLKKIGCDYDHGTGHGIGSFLSVHEGPQKIAKSLSSSDVEIAEGMILSNEPGFYEKNEFGIRIENLIIVKKLKKNKLYFETISFAPIDKDLININLLSKKEINWLNKYHQKVYNIFNKKLTSSEKLWLKKATSPLDYN